MTFPVGSRVVYTGNSKIYSTKTAIGRYGIVKSYNDRYSVAVVWDDPELNGLSGCWCVYPENIELADLDYDPTQAGDQDDDI